MADYTSHISLAFTADTKQAISAVKSLREELNGIATGTSIRDGGISQLTPEIQKAMTAATQLQASLEHATNIKTGKLDITKFSQSLKDSGTTLQEYARQLSALGDQGAEAFTHLAQAVVQAEAPILSANSKIKDLGQNLIKVAKWELSSKITHGLESAISGAYGYAQDLNESLTNIRIVTGQNTEQMAKFAEQANKAARALSTTTTDYTNASLIYYQQGLSDAEVQARTDVTIKMANAAGVAAETASDQLTAVWNNFYDGSKSLEYYADVLTALGAATASSTDEISEGLEKFAAVADTVGLSYEYATAALATVTAETRQSADVVGTAFKTLFARLQDLELGETLDDGTTLGQYSEALYKVGINIKDSSGQMKNMDTILDELGTKWKSLGKDTQTALAQTVAGTRQYTQLVALMDNYDTFKVNLDVAYDAEGALQEQQDIYAEGWEAARDRVTAALEDIYTKLVDDDAFITLLNWTEDIVSAISNIIDSLGGLKGVLFTVGTVATQLFQKQIAGSLSNVALTIKSLTPFGKAEQKQQKEDAIEGLKVVYRNQGRSNEGEAKISASTNEQRMQSILVDNESRLTAEQKTQLQIQMDLVRELDKKRIAQGKNLDAAKKETEELADQHRALSIADAQNEIKNKVKDEQDNIKKSYFHELEDKRNNGQELTPQEQAFLEEVDQVKIKNRERFDQEKLNEIREGKAASVYDKMIKNNLSKKDPEDRSYKYAEELQKRIDVPVEREKQKVEDEANRESSIIQNTANYGVRGQDLALSAQQARKSLATGNLNDKDVAKIYNEIKQKIEKAKKAAQDFNKEANNEEVKTQVGETEKYYKNLEEQLEACGKDAEELDKILEEIESDTQIIPDVNAATILATEELTGTENGELSENLQQQMQSNVKEVTLQVNTEEAESATNDLLEGMEQGINSTYGWSDALTKVSSSIMAIGSLFSSIESAAETFLNPDSSGWDKANAVFAVTASLIPAITALMQLNTLHLKENIKETYNSIKATYDKIKAKIAEKFAEEGLTLSQKIQIVVQAALNAMRLNDPIFIVVTAIVAATAALGIFTAKQKAHQEQLEKTADTSKELAEQAQQESEAYQNLANSYEDLYQQYQDGEILKKDFLQSGLDLIDELELEDGAIYLLSGRYEELAEKIKEARAEKANAAAEASRQAYEDEVAAEEDEIEKWKDDNSNYDYYATTGKWVSDVEARTYISGLAGEDNYVKPLYYKFLNELYENGEYGDFVEQVTDDYGNTFIRRKTGDLNTVQGIESFVEDNKVLVDLFEQKLKDEGVDEEKIQSSIEILKDALPTSTEGLDTDTLPAMYNTAQQDTITAELLNSEYNFNGNLEDFQQSKSDIIDDIYKRAQNGEYGKGALLWTEEEITDLVMSSLQSSLSRDENGLNNADIFNFISDAAEKSELTIEQLTEYYESLNDGEKEVFFSIDFDEVTSREHLDSAMEGLQVQANANNIKIGIQTYAAAAESLEDVSTADEYKQWFESSGISWGENGVIEKQDFLSKSKSEQQEYLQALQDQGNTLDIYSQSDLVAQTQQQANKAYEKKKYYEDLMEFSFDNSNIRDSKRVRSLIESLSAEDLNEIDYQKYVDNYNLGIDVAELKGLVQAQQQLNEATEEYDKLQEEQKTNEEDSLLQQHEYLNGASDLNDLLMRRGEIEIANGDDKLDEGVFSSALIGLAENYDNCTEEIEAYQKAVKDGDEAQITATRDALMMSVSAAELAEQYGFSAQELEDYAQQLKDSGKYTKANGKELAELAKDQKRFDKAVESSADNLDDWKEALKQNQKGAMLSGDTLEEMREAYGNLLDMDSSAFSAGFLASEQNLADFEAAIKGDEEAYKRLQETAGKGIITQLGFDESQWDSDFNAINEKLKAAGTDLEDLEIGASLDSTGVLATLMEIVNAAGMTAQEATDYLSSMGIDATVEEATDDIEETVGYNLTPVNGGYTAMAAKIGDDTEFWIPSITWDAEPVKVKKTVAAAGLAVTSANKSSGGNIKFNQSSAAANVGKSSGGGGSSKPKTVDRTKKTDVVDRYKEINDKLSVNKRLQDQNSKASDRMYGKSRLKGMKEYNSLLSDQIDLNKQKLAEAKNYLAEDTDALQKAAADLGLAFEIDPDTGNITNYTEVMTAAWKKLTDLQDAANADGNVTDEEQESIDKMQKLVDALKDGVTTYEETLQIVRDLEDENQELVYAIQDQLKEILTYKIEIKLELSDDEINLIENKLKLLDEEDFFDSAERAATIIGKRDATLNSAYDVIGGYEEAFRKGTSAYGEQGYVEILDELISSGGEALDELIELDDTMKTFYQDTLTSGLEELEKYTAQFEELTSALDHYQNIVTLINGEEDYETVGVILSGKASIADDARKTSISKYEMLAKQRAALEEQYQKATSDAERERIQLQLDAVDESMREAQEDMLAKTEEWANITYEVLQNEIAKAKKEFEELATNGLGWDALNTTMSHSSTMADEYLTKTNQIYETEKMMNELQQKIDKTTNEAAKAKLKAYQDEIQALQDKNELTNTELEIAQAKYDVMVAEITLEEAQNAKSTVRLQRDSEGNYGYVYTADQDSIASAEQELADAQNKLYNVGLDAANEYGEKLVQARQELTEELNAITEDTTLTEAEAIAQRDAAWQRYYEKEAAYSQSYTAATQADAAVAQDAWVTSYVNQMSTTEEWRNAVVNYTNSCIEKTTEWKDNMTNSSEIVNDALNNTADAVEKVTDKSEELAKTTEEVTEKVEDQITQVRQITAAWNACAQQIENVKKALVQVNEAAVSEKAATAGVSTGYNEDVDYASAMGSKTFGAADYRALNESRQKKIQGTDGMSIDEKADTLMHAFYAYGNKLGTSTKAKYFSQIADSEWPGLIGANLYKAIQSGEVSGLDDVASWLEKHAEKYDTGGYTGSWGPEGKLAMLHEKELVLNAEDTKNILTTASLISDLVKEIDIQALSSQTDKMFSALRMQVDTSTDTLEQMVTIEAHFPNVTSQSEIELAFDNLVNRASQYANRK